MPKHKPNSKPRYKPARRMSSRLNPSAKPSKAVPASKQLGAPPAPVTEPVTNSDTTTKTAGTIADTQTETDLPFTNDNDDYTSATRRRKYSPVIIQCLPDDVPGRFPIHTNFFAQLDTGDTSAIAAPTDGHEQDTVVVNDGAAAVSDSNALGITSTAVTVDDDIEFDIPPILEKDVEMTSAPSQSITVQMDKGKGKATEISSVTFITPSSTPSGPSRKRQRREISPSESDYAPAQAIAGEIVLTREIEQDMPNPFTSSSKGSPPISMKAFEEYMLSQSTPSVASTSRSQDGNVTLENITLENIGQILDAADATNSQVASAPHAPLEFMSTPDEGWPPINDGKLVRLAENMKLSQLAEWCRAQDDKFFLQVFGTTAHNKDTPWVVALLRSALQRLVGLNDPIISTPNPSPNWRDYRPRAFLLSGVPAEIGRRLLEQFCWSTHDIAFFVYRFSFNIPRYIGPFIGFTTTDAELIKQTFQAQLNTPSARALIDQLRSSNALLKQMPLDAVVNMLSRSVETDILIVAEDGRPAIPIANLYISSPTQELGKWLLWQQFLQRAVYATQYNGTGTGRPLWKCSGCHADDHPRGLCKYPKLTGWLTQPFRFNNVNDNTAQSTNGETNGPRPSGSQNYRQNQGNYRGSGRGGYRGGRNYGPTY
ncbi:hypothetical protein QCA50_004289 [Cerrena zonata]|uniref:Uncharacterized protein n=1 Tax=Cerrena zonata TaxID=2478898 RepID=A0AAW0GSZ5_9APHY